jgi:TRAP-type C4-dicarboxylate transport system permease small subunit
MSDINQPSSTTKLIASLSGLLAGGGVIAAGIVLLANVFSRQVLGSAITGAIELTGLILVVLVTFAIVHAELRSGHIGITFVVDRLPPRVQRVVDAFSTTLAVASAALMAWASWPIVQVSIARSQIHSLQLPLKLWPYRAALTGGFALLALALTRRYRSGRRVDVTQATV